MVINEKALVAQMKNAYKTYPAHLEKIQWVKE